MAGILGLPMAFLAAGIAFGGDFSTLNSSIAVPPRYLFAMAREGSMPKVFARLHPRYQTPWVSILFLGALSLVLVFYPITFVASVSLFADLFYYIIGIAAALGLRKRHPELGRPYKAPLIEVGVPVSILIYAIMLFQLDRYAIVSGIIWCVVGLVVYYICHAKYGDSNILNINDSIKKPLPQPFQTLYTGKWIMYNNGPVTASSFSFQKRTAVPIKEAVAAFLLYFQSPLAVFLDFNSFPNILRPEFPLCSTHAYGILCGQRQSLAKAAPAKDLSFLDTQIQPAKSHFARQNHTAVVTTKTMYYYSCFFRRYPVK